MRPEHQGDAMTHRYTITFDGPPLDPLERARLKQWLGATVRGALPEVAAVAIDQDAVPPSEAGYPPED